MRARKTPTQMAGKFIEIPNFQLKKITQHSMLQDLATKFLRMRLVCHIGFDSTTHTVLKKSFLIFNIIIIYLMNFVLIIFLKK